MAWPKGKPRGLYVRGTPADRWWARVDKNGPTMPGMTTACWEWRGARNRKGYGTFAPDHASSRLAHTVGWELANGPVPPGLEVCHHCDNRGCVNLNEHLYLGTHRQNIDDAIRRGRLYGRRVARGEGHYHSRFSDADIEQLRLLAALGAAPSGVLAAVFGTTTKHVGGVVQMRKRADLGPPLILALVAKARARYEAKFPTPLPSSRSDEDATPTPETRR